MKAEEDRQLLAEAQKKGTGATLGAYVKLSGPGWLQSAITLGGGSLASSLYLGVLAGFAMLWLQPFAMILGIIMLSAIGYVTLSTGERPFQAINKHVNPVLGWGWALASLAANMVWCLPQYSLATGVLQGNLLPDVLGPDSQMDDFNAKLLITGTILVVTTLVTWSYDSGSWGIRLYEGLLKLMVAVIVLCFIGVVIRLTFTTEGLNWSDIFQGFVPDLSMLTRPAVGFREMIAELPNNLQGIWETRIVNEQRDIMISAAATAVGINMTFLLPYSLLRRGWTKEFRGLLTFDLSTGMLIPFLLATSCVILASANQFHTKSETLAKAEGKKELSQDEKKELNKAKETKLKKELGDSAFQKLPPEEATTQINQLTLTVEEKWLALMNGALTADSISEALAKAEGKEDLSDADKVKLNEAKIVRLKEKLGASAFEKLSSEEVNSGIEKLTLTTKGKLQALMNGSEKVELTKAKKMSLKVQLGTEGWEGLSEKEQNVAAKQVQLSPQEEKLALALAQRGAMELAQSLRPLTGDIFANYIFGLGVLGMTLSTITILMLISGLVICEILNIPTTGWSYRLGTLAAATGVLGPFIWSQYARFYLAIPASVFGMTLLPFAYLSFFFLMNQRKLLGDQMPQGGKRWLFNLLMAIAAGVATFASLWVIWDKANWYGIGGVIGLLVLALVVQFMRVGKPKQTSE